MVYEKSKIGDEKKGGREIECEIKNHSSNSKRSQEEEKEDKGLPTRGANIGIGKGKEK